MSGLRVKQGDSLNAAVKELLTTWDTSSDVLGPEWNGIATRIEAVRAALPGGIRPQFAWLIERGQSERQVPTVWWILGERESEPTTREGERWTQDAYEATWFSTKTAADAVIARLFTGPLGDVSAKATEHGFG